METINFLLRDRGEWNSNIQSTYSPRDTVRVDASQYYTLTEIAAGNNIFRPDSTNVDNPWDLLVSGNVDALSVQGDNTIVTANPDLSSREVQASAPGNILTYNSAAAIAPENRIAFGPANTTNSLIVRRFALDHNGFLPEGEFPVRVGNFMFLTASGDIQAGGFITGLSSLPPGPGLGANARFVRVIHTDGRIFALDSDLGNPYNLSLGEGTHPQFGNRTSPPLFVQSNDQNIVDIIPYPFDLERNEDQIGRDVPLADPRGRFLISTTGQVTVSGNINRLTAGFVNVGTSLSQLAATGANVDRIRQLGNIFAFRSNNAGTFSWYFIMRDGQAGTALGITDSTSISNSSDSTPFTSTLYDNVIDLTGRRGNNFEIYGYDTDGMLIYAGLNISGSVSPLRTRLPQVEVNGVMVDQNVVQVTMDQVRTNGTNTLIRSDRGRVYFIGIASLLGGSVVGQAIPITFTNPDTGGSFTQNLFIEVALPAGKFATRVKWSRKAFHILFDDGTLYGAGLNEDYHLGIATGGTTTPQPLSKVGNLPYPVVDWGSYIQNYVEDNFPSTLDSQTTLITRFLLRDTAQGAEDFGIYFVCGTARARILDFTNAIMFALGNEHQTASRNPVDDVIRYPRPISNSGF